MFLQCLVILLNGVIAQVCNLLKSQRFGKILDKLCIHLLTLSPKYTIIVRGVPSLLVAMVRHQINLQIVDQPKRILSSKRRNHVIVFFGLRWFRYIDFQVTTVQSINAVFPTNQFVNYAFNMFIQSCFVHQVSQHLSVACFNFPSWCLHKQEFEVH